MVPLPGIGPLLLARRTQWLARSMLLDSVYDPNALTEEDVDSPAPQALAARSQFWSQLSSFVAIRKRSDDRFPSANGDLRISLDVGLRIWKAGWAQALAGSNPASSAAGADVRTLGGDRDRLAGENRRRSEAFNEQPNT